MAMKEGHPRQRQLSASSVAFGALLSIIREVREGTLFLLGHTLRTVGSVVAMILEALMRVLQCCMLGSVCSTEAHAQ